MNHQTETRFPTILGLIFGIWWTALQAGDRTVVSLDGLWQVADGRWSSVPKEFPHTVPVPGLLDLARPEFDGIGYPSDGDRAFWYRRTFRFDGPVPDIVRVKVHQAKYGTRVFVNGKPAGEHLHCFTPGYFDVAGLLRGNGAENEIVIGVGAGPGAVPQSIPTGYDFEKYRYIPGIDGRVEVIAVKSPAVANAQVVPDPDRSRVRVVTWLEASSGDRKTTVTYRIQERSTGNTVAEAKSENMLVKAGEQNKVDIHIPVTGCTLWTPENPFLYALTIETDSDRWQTRFGMRTFRFDKPTGRAILNGKPYFMRGTNVCVYRFYEDGARGYKPWQKAWVRRLHRQFKAMHWNSIRYCIGFPPEIWYEVADEEGFLIQDEFPIWYGNRHPAEVTAETVAAGYEEWMRERWNHPCVVIWDAQNETITAETGKAIQRVRHLDLSNRPWDNGWSPPQADGDGIESHPYLFGRFRNKKPDANGALAELLKEIRVPRNSPSDRSGTGENYDDHAIVINEYGWLWLNRDGTPTSLTKDIYANLLGAEASIPEMRYRYARFLAALTEYWRGHRKCAGVLHFCGLGYSRPGGLQRPVAGATSDHFMDLEALTFEPNFEVFVGDAFAPVGIMIDFWDQRVQPGSTVRIPVVVINDLYEDWNGQLRLSIVNGDGGEVSRLEKPCTVKGLGREEVAFGVKMPHPAGSYQMVAELVPSGQASPATAEGSRGPTRSLRDLVVQQ